MQFTVLLEDFLFLFNKERNPSLVRGFTVFYIFLSATSIQFLLLIKFRSFQGILSLLLILSVIFWIVFV